MTVGFKKDEPDRHLVQKRASAFSKARFKIGPNVEGQLVRAGLIPVASKKRRIGAPPLIRLRLKKPSARRLFNLVKP